MNLQADQLSGYVSWSELISAVGVVLATSCVCAQVEQKQLSANINLSRLLGPEWTAMPQCLFGRVRKQVHSAHHCLQM